MKKILLISYYWKNDNSVGKLRWYNLVQELKKLNYDITVFSFGDEHKIIEKDNFTEIIWNNNSFLNSFKERYLKNYSKGVIDSSDGLFVKFLSWIRVNFFYPDARLSNFNKIENFLVDYIDKKGINLLITTSPPHSIQLLGQMIKKKTGIEWISDFRDPYLSWDILLSMNPLKLSKKIHSNYQYQFLNKSDKIITTSSQLRNEFLQLTNNKIEVITNGSSYYPSNKYSYKKFILSYFGLLNKLRHPKVLIEILDELLEEDEIFYENFEFHLYGNIQKTTLSDIENKKYLSKKTFIKSYVSNNKISDEIDSSSILLLLLNNTKNQNTTPYKLFDYLVSEKNILTLGDYPSADVDSLLKKYKRSNRLNYSDRESIKDYIYKIFELYKNKKLEKLELDYSELRYNYLAKKLESFINS
ncbi:MAG: hypothetical protein VW741_01325 [Flammeovirgaceae bacterium]